MKIIRIVGLLVFFVLCSVGYAQEIIGELVKETEFDPLLVVVLMVKDEEHVIRETLQPFVDGGIDAYFIFDTGSTDKTVEVAQEYFINNGIERAYIEQEPFIDFSTSRNRALERAEELFPEAAFMIMPDAEWYIQNASLLREFCEQHKHEECPAYLIRMSFPELDFYLARLIRCGSGARFGGVVHEALDLTTGKRVPDDVFFEMKVTERGLEKTINRFSRDRDLLFKSYEEEPDDPRTVFYLAQTYEALGDLENAYLFYKKRINLLGWDEENFVALCRLASVIERLSKEHDTYSWDDALGFYLQAFSMRPSRAESLVRIAQHYLSEDNHQLSFLFARRAVEIPYPYRDVLFVEKGLYNYDRYEILGRCAWYVGEYELGEKAIRTALETYPDSMHLYRNLVCYLEREKEEQGMIHLIPGIN